MKKLTLTLTILFAVLTGSKAWATGGTLTGNGTSLNPYIINDLADWNTFAGWLNNGLTAGNYNDKYYKLGADIGTAQEPVTTMASEYYSNPFRGNFNGNGHTITVALTRTTIPDGDEHLQGLALFHYAGDDCNIHDLHVAGTINTCGKYGAGFIAYILKGSDSSNPRIVSISRCRSSVLITSTVEGDATSAGFVGASKKYVNLVLNNCRFDGAFVSSTATQFCGMVGWQDGSGHANILNCLVKPGAGMNLTAPDGNHYTYCRYGGESFGMINSYYYAAIGTEQGNSVGDMGNDDLKNTLGAAWLVQDDEVLPYAISYNYTLIDHYTATDYNVPQNFLNDQGFNGYAKLVDGNKKTYWEVWPSDWTPISIDFQSETPFVLKGYVLTMAPDIQDNPRHNPVEWYLRGKNANGEWEEIDHRGGWQVDNHYEYYCDENLPAMNSAEKVYVLTDNTNTYQQFQFEIIRVSGYDNQSFKRFEMAELQMFGLMESRDLANACISGVETQYMWNNGNPIEVNCTVTDYNGNVLTEGIDYVKLIRNLVNEVVSPVTEPGNYTLNVTGTGNENHGYFGTQSVGFNVTDHPSGLSVDHLIPEGTIGHYYIDLPQNRQTSIDLNTLTPPFTTPFKVYDDRGKNFNFTKGCSEDLLVTAPEDYVLQVSGTIDLGDETLLEFYDGTWGETLMAGNFNRCIGENIGVLITTGPQLAIKYNTSTTTSFSGLDLTVMPVPVNANSAIIISNPDPTLGSVTASVSGSAVTSATVNDLVTLTATPAEGYMLNDFSVTDALGNPVTVAGAWYTDNTGTFIMPGSEVTVCPNFVPAIITPIELSINMPRYSSGPSDALVATISESVECFKIYDNGGPNHNYSFSSNGYLLLVAPENKVIQLTAVTMHNVMVDDYLEVFDGNTTDYPLGGPYSYNDDLGILTTTGNQMLLHFICNNTHYHTDDGLDLVARVYDITEEFSISVTSTEHGTVAIDPAAGNASVSSTVTLTFTPNEGFTGYRPMDFVTNYPSVLVDGGWYSNNVMTFPMPAGPVIVTPNYTTAITAEDGLYVNMPKKNTYATSRMVDIPTGVSSFKVYDDGGPDDIFSDFCDGYMILTASEGFRIKLTGTVQCEQSTDCLEVYDGNTTEQLIGKYGYSTFDTSEDIGTIYSSGRSLLLHFQSNNWNQLSLDDGLDLKVETVTLPSPYLTFSGFTATAGQNGYDPSAENESWPSLVDNTTHTVWRTHNDTGVGFRTCWVEFHHTEPIVPKKYFLVTGNQTKNHPGRLPKSWILKGKLNETDEWTTITTVEDDEHLLPLNDYAVEFSLEENHQAFQYYRFEVKEVQGHEPGSNEFWDDYVMELNELYFKGYKASEVQNDLSFATINGVEPIYVYTGNTFDINYIVTDVNGDTLTVGTDYLGAIEPYPVQAPADYELTISANDGSGFTGNQSLSFKVIDYPLGVEVDNVYESPTQLGYYYVTMPKTGTKTIDLSHPEGFTTSIKIYDDGGSSGNYSNECNGDLLLQAPEGYVLQLTGTVTCDGTADYLKIYNGSTTYDPILGKEKFGSEDGEDIGTLITTGRDMLLHFYSSYSYECSGLNLTLSIISTTETHAISFDYVVSGTAIATPNPASVGGIVALTPSSNPGYLIYDFIAKDTYDHDLDMAGNWYDNSTFTMPGSEVTVTPVATHRLSSLGGLYVNMTRNIDMSTFHPQTVNIPEGVSSFKVYDNGGKDGNYHVPCNDAMVLNAPEGYVLRVEGTGNFGSIGFNETLKIFNGDEWTMYEGGNHVVIGPLTSVGNQMQLQFHNTNSGHSGFDLTVTVYKPNTWGEGTDGSADHPYEISNLDGLQTLAALSESDDFAGIYFKLTHDIGTESNPFRKVIGDNVDHPFSGIFDGDGHTITVALTNENAFVGEDEAEQGTALFHYVGDNCLIQNLTVDGTITTANKFAGGFIAYIKAGDEQSPKTVTLSNCHSSVEITSTKSGDNTTGGFIGLVKEYVNLNLNGCLFDGAFISDQGTQFSGFVGYVGNHVNTTITNGIMVADLSGLGKPNGNHYAFCRYNEHSAPVFNGDNFYYNAIVTEQGTKVYKVTLPLGVTTIRTSEGTSGNGDALYYTDGCLVNNIPYYTSNIEGPIVTIGPLTSFIITSATVSYGEISWGTNPNGDGTYWFNMPAADVTVTASMGTQFTVEGYYEGEGGWVFLAIPTMEDVAVNTTTGIVVVPQSDYDLYRFNQSAEMEWENSKTHWNDSVNPFVALEHGKGYLYARKETTTLTFAGTFNWTEPQDVSLDYDHNAELAGWNLIGNPFPTNAYVDRPYYMMNDAGTDIIPVERYWAVDVPACTGVMVHSEDADDNKATFNRTEPEQKAKREGGLLLTLTKVDARSEEEHDRAVVSFNENLQLEKYIFNEDHSKLFIQQNDKDYAIVYSEKTGEMPLSFKAVQNGKYTLAVRPVFAQMEYLHLLDLVTGADVDLMTTPVYSFTSNAGEFDSRFRLVFSAYAIGENEDNNDASFAFVSNGEIILTCDVEHATLQIVDLMGRVIVSRRGDGIQRVSTSGMVPGIYVLRLIDGNVVRTQKIVIE